MQFYAFPAPRLEATGERYIRSSESAVASTEEESATSESLSAPSAPSDAGVETDTENGTTGDAAVDAIEAQLANNGMRVVDRDDDAGTPTVEKMRDTYRVEPGRVIEGDSRFRQRLKPARGG